MAARLIPLFACTALAACNAEREAPPPASPAATQSADAVAPAPPPQPSPSASPTAETLALPLRFTALGTEPFWAAKVDGAQLTYQTPEDQGGQSTKVTRAASAQSVELQGTLGGKPLKLTVTKGPCSDGMSDTVYPFAVERRLGEDIQHGCARPD